MATEFNDPHLRDQARQAEGESERKEMRKFTFKRNHLSGLMAVGHPHPSVDIKIGGKVVGTISPPSWRTKDRVWRVRFAAKKDRTKEDPAPFYWVTLKLVFQSEEHARTWLSENARQIQNAMELHQFED